MYNRRALARAKANGVNYGTSISDLAEQSASKDKEVPTADMRLTDADLEERGYDSSVIEIENGILVDLEAGEVLGIKSIK